MCLRRVYPEAGIPLITLSADKLCKKLSHQPQISLHSSDKLSHNIISHARMFLSSSAAVISFTSFIFRPIWAFKQTVQNFAGIQTGKMKRRKRTGRRSERGNSSS